MNTYGVIHGNKSYIKLSVAKAYKTLAMRMACTVTVIKPHWYFPFRK